MKLPNIKNIKISEVLAKTAGYGSLGLLAYDSHVAGTIEGPRTEKNFKAENLSDQYLNNMKLDSPSIVKSEVKKGIFRFMADETLSSFFTNIGGYVSGFSKMLVSNVIPLGLSIGAVCTKGAVSKGFGIGLAAYGGIFLLQEAFGIGKSHK